MTECEIKERIKAFALGCSDEQVAEAEEITVQEAELFRKNHEAEISKKREEINNHYR